MSSTLVSQLLGAGYDWVQITISGRPNSAAGMSGLPPASTGKLREQTQPTTRRVRSIKVWWLGKL